MLALEDEPLAVVLRLRDGCALERELLEALAAAEDVAQCAEALLGQGRVGEDERAQVRERGRHRRRDRPERVRRQVQVRQPPQEGEVGQRGDRVVRQVERVERVARDSEVLDG